MNDMTSFNQNPRRAFGFTLIELMITVSIIAILITIAFPSYRPIQAKSDRAIAKAELSDIALAQARYFSVSRAYTIDFKLLKMNGTTTATISDAKGYYNYVLTQASSSDYTITATPIANGSRDKWALRLNESGTKNKEDTEVGAISWENGWP